MGIMSNINVTKTFLPPQEEFQKYLDRIWENSQLTNQGPLLLELENKLREFLGVENLHVVSNGTMALQLALRALDITEGEIITTPFSYVATASSILWEHCSPVFVDIEPDSFSIDASKIEAAITQRTKAILPVHVFGLPCNTERIDQIAQSRNLRLVYDGAHAFGAHYKDRSLLDYGDISTGSFHATKLFHTIEGGCLIVKDKLVSEKIELLKRFGHNGDEHYTLGINAKASEFQAAMGLCNLKYLNSNIEARKKITELYDSLLQGVIVRPKLSNNLRYNYPYYPVVFENETQLLRILNSLNKINIFPRRYFYPSLNTLPYLNQTQSCPVSEDIASRILCLPLYPTLETENVHSISEVIKHEANH